MTKNWDPFTGHTPTVTGAGFGISTGPNTTATHSSGADLLYNVTLQSVIKIQVWGTTAQGYGRLLVWNTADATTTPLLSRTVPLSSTSPTTADKDAWNELAASAYVASQRGD